MTRLNMKEAYLDSQRKAIDKLSNVYCGALFMEAGTGKTLSALELVRNQNPDYVLWFTPFQTKENLRAEIDKWGGLDCDIVGIESIQNSDRIYLELYRKLESAKNPFLIMDESLKIKNADAIRTSRALELSRLCQNKLILNGTPLSRNLLDLWSQMEFLDPRILNMGIAEFKNTFCEYIQVKKYSAGFGSAVTKEFIKKYHNVEHLYKLIEPFIFESKLSLSVGQQHLNMRYSLSEKEIHEHDLLKKKYLDEEWMLFKNNNIFIEITQKMQHNYSLSQEKFRIVDEIIKGHDPSKVLIYAKYIDTQEALKNYYKNIRINSLQKHSYSLNLQDYNVIIFWDKTWDYAQREQSERRIYRTGQKDECLYYDLTGNVGLESMIDENIEKKRGLLDVFAGMTIGELREKL